MSSLIFWTVLTAPKAPSPKQWRVMVLGWVAGNRAYRRNSSSRARANFLPFPPFLILIDGTKIKLKERPEFAGETFSLFIERWVGFFLKTVR